MRILYFADIRFPLERANGIQTMETCHALAGRGHEVHLVVRPDTHTPARDPFAYYGLPPLRPPDRRARAGRRTAGRTPHRVPRLCGHARRGRRPRRHRDDARSRGRVVAAAAALASSARLRIPRLRAGGRGGAAASRVDGDGTASGRSSRGWHGASRSCGGTPTVTSRSPTAWHPPITPASAPAAAWPSCPTARD